MILGNRNQLISCIVTLAALAMSSFSYAGSLLKVDVASQQVLSEALEKAKKAYEKEYEEKDGVTFKRSSFVPHVTLLFLSASDNDSDLIKVDENRSESAAELVKVAAMDVAVQFNPIEVTSEMKIIHQSGHPNGVPSSGILPGTEYHSVVIELPAATQALTPLMEALKKSVSATVIRKSANDFAPRIHLTVGYVVGAKASEIVLVDHLKEQAKFRLDSFILDFPKLEGFKNLAISFK
jgi:2'-5' RNA ligase